MNRAWIPEEPPPAPPSRGGGSPLPHVMLICSLVLACAGGGTAASRGSSSSGDPNDLLVVDCLLPGQIRQLGSQMTYLTARRPVKTSAVECKIRGGEYTSYDRASYSTALRVWLEAAKSGDPEAQTNVGEIFEKGLGLTPDFEAAAEWYRRAAEQGHAPAQINLGQLYEIGRGVPKDPRQALVWYRRASGLEDLGGAGAIRFQPSVPTQNEMGQLKTDLERRESEIARLRQELQRAERTAADARTEAAAAPDPSDLIAMEAEIARLRQESDGLRQQIAASNPRPGADLPPPSIRLLDPEVPLTRGVQVVQSVAVEAVRVVVGHVDAPAGLMSLTVNDRSVTPEKKGIFRSDVKVRSDGTRVRIVAADKAGARAIREFVLKAKEGSDTAVEEVKPRKTSIDFGNYHALVIGNDGYQKLSRLRTARADAGAVGKILEQKFGFKVTTLYDATRYDILNALNKLRASLTPNDNLVIYYAGHGELDRANSRGHWLPIDAEPDSTANWISNIALTDILNAMSARHVIVVADSCYSGALTRSSLARLEAGSTDEARQAWLKAMAGKRSRTALTSGGLAPVLDSGGGKNSIFAKALLDVLGAATEPIEGQRLFHELSARVAWAAEAQRFEQLPQYAPIKFAGHESGDFFFVPGI